jgi:hypothetical protein
MVRLSRNSRPQTQIGIRMGMCMLWRQRFIPCQGGYPIMEMNVKLGAIGYGCRAGVHPRFRLSIDFICDIVFNVIAVRRTVFL